MAATNRSKELKAAKMKAANNVHPLKELTTLVRSERAGIQWRWKQFQKNGNLCTLLAAG